MGAKNAPLAIRLKRNSVKAVGGCLIWQGSKHAKGYGQIWDVNRMVKTHRAAFLLAKGPIRKGYQLHHTCENRACINPAHLVMVTPTQHKRLHLKTHCLHGHEFNSENTRHRANGGRICIQCMRRQQLAWYHKNKGI